MFLMAKKSESVNITMNAFNRNLSKKHEVREILTMP